MNALRATLVLLLYSLQFLATSCSSPTDVALLTFHNSNGSVSPQIRAEVVSSPAARTLGLMYRKEMADTAGMLFLFPHEEELSFWMKNTYLELDIIFIDKNWKVVSISEKATPLSETARKSSAPAQYVLEVKGGLAKSWGVSAGSSVHIDGKLPNGQ